MNALFPYVATTAGVTVRVSVSYLADQSQPAQARWFWAYHIRIENEGDAAVQLLTRRWEITDARGARQIVEGDGVVGEQPVIAPGETWDYVSGCPLSTPSGSMEGQYGMRREDDGAPLTVAVPRFALRAPVVAR